MSKEDVSISVEKSTLKIKAEKETSNEIKFIRKEFDYASFEKSFSLPKSINIDAISAKVEKGVLNITLPKKEEAKELPAKEIVIE